MYKKWDCTVNEDTFGQAVESLNSFDIIIIYDWRKDPRLWYTLFISLMYNFPEAVQVFFSA